MLLSNWYGKLFSSVRWGGGMSYTFLVCAGLKQGGILSPALFSIVVDSVLAKLSNLLKPIIGFNNWWNEYGIWYSLMC